MCTGAIDRSGLGRVVPRCRVEQFAEPLSGLGGSVRAAGLAALYEEAVAVLDGYER